MTLEVHLSHVLTFAGLLVVTLGGFMKLLMIAHEQRINERFAYIDAKFHDMDKRHERHEEARSLHYTDFMNFKSELPRQYVPREDYMRNQIVLEAKLDTLSEKFENLSLKVARA
jgi:hypothetical protein